MIFSQSAYFMKDTPVVWIFGCLLSLPFLLLIALESFSLQLQESDIVSIAPKIVGIFLISLLFFFASEAGLILSLKKTSSALIEYVAATGALIRWYFLFLLILLGFFAFFFAPLSFASGSAGATLKYISLTFFLFIASGAFILKMFGSFYLLLGKLSLGSALRSAAALFMNHLVPSILLFLATTLLSLIGSIITSTLHSFLSFPLSDGAVRNTILLLTILFLSAFLNIFLRAFWYFFFQAIAAEKPKDWQEEKKMVEESMVPAEDEA